VDKNKALIALSESDKTKVGKEDFAAQSDPQKVFSAIWDLQMEVNNGGFWQYFANSSAETAYFVREALEAIGATKTADICTRAVNIAFPNGLPKTPEEISRLALEDYDKLTHELDALDQEFFRDPSGDNLTELLYDCVLKNPLEFGKPPFPERCDVRRHSRQRDDLKLARAQGAMPGSGFRAFLS
jgi:uncharacterized protein DUF4375